MFNFMIFYNSSRNCLQFSDKVEFFVNSKMAAILAAISDDFDGGHIGGHFG